MADNYLEKRMEDYRRGIDHTKPRRVVTPTGSRPYMYERRLDVRNVLVAVADQSLGADIAAAFAACGCRAAFLASNIATANRQAQKDSTLAWPDNRSDSIDDAISSISTRFGSVDLLVSDRPGQSSVPKIEMRQDSTDGYTLLYILDVTVKVPNQALIAEACLWLAMLKSRIL